MAADEQEIIARFIADTTGFTAGAQEVITQSQQIEAATSSMAQGAGQASQGLNEIGTAGQKAGQEIGSAAAGFAMVGKSAEDAGQSASTASGGMSDFAEAGGKAAKSAQDAGGGIAVVGKASEEAGSAGKAGAAGVEEIGTASSKAASAAAPASAAITATGKSAEEAGNSAGKAAGGFNLMEGAMMAMIAIQLAQMLVQVITALDQVQQAAKNSEQAFTTLMHSEMNARQELAILNSSAAADDFGKQKVADAAQYFLMLGKDANTTNTEIYKVSDALASVGKSGDQLIPAINDLHSIQKEAIATHDSIDQLAKDGVPAWDALAQGMTNARGHLVTVAEAQKEVDAGAIHGADAYKYMMNGMVEYTGKAEQSSDTLAGKWQQLGSEASSAFGPLIDVAKIFLDGLRAIVEGVKAVEDALRSLESNPLVGLLMNMTPAGMLGGIGMYGVASGHASGIVDSPVGHLSWVGEEGPELMWVPQGASIFPNGTNPLVGAGAGGASMPSLSFGGGPQTVELHIHMDSATIARQTIPLIAPQIRVLTGGRK